MENYGIGNLPEELEHEILLMLPVKALMVCKCVCKDWCALIKSPSFVNRHFNHESNQESLYFERPQRYVYRKPYAFYKYQDDERHSLIEESYHLQQIPSHIGFIGLEKGIFCVISKENKRLGLLNPATREFKTLPPHPLHDPSALRPHIGFGLDPSSGDFKVVVFRGNTLCKFAFVYTLSSDSWKRIEAMDRFVDYYQMGITALNGQHYWLVKFVDRDVFSILAFDMRSEKFQEIAVPHAIEKIAIPFIGRIEMGGLKLIAYCDSLGLISYKFNECIDLWVMGRDGLWSKSCSIDPFQEIVWPLCVWKKNEVFFDSRFSQFLIMCDISTQKVRRLIPPGVETYPKYYYLTFTVRYKESLVSLKGDRADCLSFQDIFTYY